MKDIWTALSIAFVVGFLLTLAPACGGEDPSETHAPSMPKMTPHQLFEERAANATRFDDTYVGRKIQVEGEVKRIDNSKVYLSAGLINEVALEGLPRDVQASLDKSDTFTAVCTVGHKGIRTMTLKDCR